MRFIGTALVSAIVTAIVVSILVFLFALPKGNDPLLSGPPEFIILAIILALAAFLRAVSLQAIELRDKIIHDDVWNYPRGEKYADDRVKSADMTYDTIHHLTPFLIIMIVVVCGRIICDAFVRVFYIRGHNPRALYAFDIFIVICLFLGFLGLAIAHFITRTEDDRIQRESRSHEDSNLARRNKRMEVRGEFAILSSDTPLMKP